MAFCNILSNFCLKIFIGSKDIYVSSNAVENPFQRDIDFPSCDARSIEVAITAY